MTFVLGDYILLHVVTFLAWTLGVAGLTTVICRRYMAHSESESDDYFVGGRAFKWYITAGSMILTNLSTEQLVGLNGAVFKDGCLAGIWWEAGAAIAMIITATVFLPRFMALGLTTTTGFLQERYGLPLRTLVAMIFLLHYTVVLCPLVLYTGALSIHRLFDFEDLPLAALTLPISILASAYALCGGIKAVAVSDLLNGLGLMVIAVWVPVAAVYTLPDGIFTVFDQPALLRPLVGRSQVFDTDSKLRFPGEPSVPWHVTFTGLFLTNVSYWSINQVIVQRVLASESLAQGQKGLLFAACMKVVAFILLCLPGVLGILMEDAGVEVEGKAFRVDRSDDVFPLIVRAVMPNWFLGVFSAVMLGTVLSSFNSLISSASTMFAIEVYNVWMDQAASDHRVVRAATLFGGLLTIVSAIIAPYMESIDSIFTFLQNFNTFVSAPILTVFIVGIAVSRPNAVTAKLGFGVSLLTCAIGYYCNLLQGGLHHLHLFFISCVAGITTMLVVTYVPRVLQAFGQDRKPHIQADPNGKALVNMFPWAHLYPVSYAILAVIAMLMFGLQLGSAHMCFLFAIAWALLTCTVMCLSARPPEVQSRKTSGDLSSRKTRGDQAPSGKSKTRNTKPKPPAAISSKV